MGKISESLSLPEKDKGELRSLGQRRGKRLRDGQARPNKRSKMDDRGQSVVEFVLIMTFLLGFIFFFLQLSMVFAFGNYVQYATFMAARAYQSAGADEDDQHRRAQAVIINMVKRSELQGGRDRWPGLGQGDGGDGVAPRGIFIGAGEQFQPDNGAYSWLEGVRYRFRSKIFILPIGQGLLGKSVTLQSESWLGRHPSYQDCVKYLQDSVRTVRFDNGC